MYALIVMTCVGLSCGLPEMVSFHSELRDCERAMEEEYKKIEPGQAVMCVKEDKVRA
jgi:hypothetical protein